MLCLVTQLCPTLCNPTDCSLLDYSLSTGCSRKDSVHGMLQERLCLWDAPGKTLSVGCSRKDCPWDSPGKTLSAGFSRKDYWRGLPCPPPGNLPNPGAEPTFPTLRADFLPIEPPRKPLKVIQFSSVQFSRLVVSDSAIP